MIVRIRFESGPKIKKTPGKNRHIALALASLLTPITLLAFVLGGWRLLSDLGATTAFPITQGAFSHWQVWLALGGVTQTISVLLNRYGRVGGWSLARATAGVLAVTTRTHPSPVEADRLVEKKIPV
jgi:hypothetical protein